MAVLFSTALFAGIKVQNKSVFSENSAPVATDASSPLDTLSFLNISEENYSYTAADFTPYKEAFAIYSNKTITLNRTFDLSPSMRFQITIDNRSEEDLGDFEFGKVEGERAKSWFFDINRATSDLETAVYVKIEKDLPATPNQKPTTLIYELRFYLIQTPTDFEKENSNTSKKFISFSYIFNNQHFETIAPTTGETYNTLSLTFPAGTPLNPIFVSFDYLGETYTISRYKTWGDSGEVIKTFNTINNQEINIDKLVFDKSGKYNVRIYDKTVETNCPSKNFLEYSFVIKNTTASTTSAFYIDAHDESGNILMNERITNETVILDFVNFSDISRNVKSIKIVRFYHPTVSENIPEETVYSPANLPSSIKLDKDGTYSIKLEDANDNIIYEYEIIILKSIRSSFEIDNTTYKIEDYEPSNMTKEFLVHRTVRSSYNGIEGNTNYDFKVVVARSAPAISGISNNARSQSTVNLSVSGVGKINVYATFNGKKIDLEVDENGNLPPLTDRGKYYIRITDEMGVSATKSFTITIKLNAPALILIGLAAAALLGLIIFIIISRGKFKVR